MTTSHARRREVWLTIVIILWCALWVMLWMSLGRTQSSQDEVAWDITASEVVQVRYASPGLEVSLTQDEGRWWADVQYQPDPAHDPGRLDVQRFLIDPVQQQHIELALSPLVTPRQWPAYDPATHAEFGLRSSSSPATLMIRSREEVTRTFSLGKEGFGHRRVYAEDLGSGQVIMLDGELIRALRFAQRDLIDPDLLDIPLSQIQILSITSHERPPRHLTLVPHHEDEAMMSYWSFESRPGRSRVAASWMQRVLTLRASAAPVAASAWWIQDTMRHVTLSVTGARGERELLDIKVVEEGSQTRYLAKSTRTRDTVVVLYEGPTSKLLDQVEALFTASTQEVLLAPPDMSKEMDTSTSSRGEDSLDIELRLDADAQVMTSAVKSAFYGGDGEIEAVTDLLERELLELPQHEHIVVNVRERLHGLIDHDAKLVVFTRHIGPRTP